MKTNIPSSWSEVNLGDGMRILSNPITTGQTIDEYNEGVLNLYVDINDMTLEERKDGLDKILNLMSSNPRTEYNREFIIYGKNYMLDTNLKDLTWGWFLDMETIIANSEEGNIWSVMDKVIASLLRPVTYSGTWKKTPVIEPYNSDTLLERADLFKKALTINDVFGISLFFCLIGMTYMKKITDSLLPNSVNDLTQTSEQTNTQKFTD